MKIKNILSFSVVLFSLFIIWQGVGSATTFVDDFNSQTYFDDNWMVVEPTWTIASGTANGFGGIPDGTAAAAANNGIPFYNTGLTIETVFRVDNYGAGIFFSTYYDEGLETYDGYGVKLDSRHPINGTPTFSVQTLYEHDGTHEYASYSLPLLDLNEFYMMQVIIDDSINAYLYNEAGSSLIASLTDVPLKLSASYGAVGINANYEGTFKSFSLNGNAVPVPTTILLLGSGLIGIIGIRNKYKNQTV